MTRTKRSFRLPVAVALAGLASTTTVSLAVANPASAYESSSAPTIASRADAALTALARWQTTARVADFDDFLRQRDQTALATASELQESGEVLAAAWGNVSIDKQQALLTALTQLGVPYRSRASKEDVAFDCSGLMLFAYAKSGIELPRSSRDQINAADDVDAAAAQPGDLVYYPGHISMYLGMGLMVHSPQSGQDVEVRHLFDRSLRFGDAFSALKPQVAGVTADDLPSLVNGTAGITQ